MAEKVYPFAHWVGIEKLSDRALEYLLDASLRNGWDPNALVGHLAIESGFDHRARNPASGARGIAQWLPSAKGGVEAMSLDEQVRAAVSWFEGIERQVGKPLHSLEDFRIAGWGGANWDGPDDVVISKPGTCDPGRGNDGTCDADGARRNGTVRRRVVEEVARARVGDRWEGFFAWADVVADPYNGENGGGARTWWWTVVPVDDPDINRLTPAYALEKSSAGRFRLEKVVGFDRNAKQWWLASVSGLTPSESRIFDALAQEQRWREAAPDSTAEGTIARELKEAEAAKVYEVGDWIAERAEEIAEMAKAVAAPVASGLKIAVAVLGVGLGGFILYKVLK